MVKLDIVDTGNIVEKNAGKSVKKQNGRKVIPNETFAIHVDDSAYDCHDDYCKCHCFVSSCIVMLIVVIILFVLFV